MLEVLVQLEIFTLKPDLTLSQIDTEYDTDVGQLKNTGFIYCSLTHDDYSLSLFQKPTSYQHVYISIYQQQSIHYLIAL